MNFKNIHIGKMIEQRVMEIEVDMSRICTFFQLEEQQVREIYQAQSMPVSELLRWSKFLRYDFFRLYTQHIMLYSPACSVDYYKEKNSGGTGMPVFRKNIYTREIIDFILEMIESGKKTIPQVIEEYRIPKTTLYKWISKRKSKQ